MQVRQGLVSSATAESVQAFLAANQTFQGPAAPAAPPASGAAAPASGAAPAGDGASGRAGRCSLQPCSLKRRWSACALLCARSWNGRPSAFRPAIAQQAPLQEAASVDGHWLLSNAHLMLLLHLTRVWTL